MTSEVTIRMITIGTSIFIALITITAVMGYYNMSRNAISEITVTNLAANYNENIKQVLYNDIVTGAELKNMLQYFSNNGFVNLWLTKFYYLDNKTNTVKRKDLTFEEGDRFNTNNSSQYRNFMQNGLYNQKFKVEHLTYDNYELFVKFTLIEK